MVNVAYPGTKIFNDFIGRHKLYEDIMEDYTAWEYLHRDDFITRNCPHGIVGIPLGNIDSKDKTRDIQDRPPEV